MRINRNDSIGLVIDFQEKLFPHMDRSEELLKRTGILLDGLRLLKVPVMVTEQYPKGLGLTLPEIRSRLRTEIPLEKISFSCCADAGFSAALKKMERGVVIICGIETHVCVLQTSLDLIEEGHLPVVVTDCTSSRHAEDRAVALERMRASGVLLTTCESILFELTRVAGSEEFKSLSKLIKPL